MGACFSSNTTADYNQSPSAQVISIHGELHEYSLPVFVSQILQSEGSASSSSSSNSIFLCNSDHLCYDEHIPVLDFNHQLQPNQIYFVLPLSKLENRLSSKDMAALAVKATIAIGNKDSRKKKARISPVSLLPPDESSLLLYQKAINNKKPKPPAISRSGSVRKFQRYTSRRAKLAVKSFRLRLSTIYEGSVL